MIILTEIVQTTAGEASKIMWGDMAQVAQVFVSLGGIAWFVWEYRKRTKENGYRAYVDASLAYVELERSMLDHPEMQQAYFYDSYWRQLPESQRSTAYFFSMLVMLFEIIYIAHERKWLECDEWEGWKEWMQELMNESLVFQNTWQNVKGLYSRKFIQFIDSLASQRRALES